MTEQQQNSPHKDLTTGPIGPHLWKLAWPMMLSIFFYTLYNLVDAFWVSKVSDAAIAAVGVSQITLFIMVALSMGLTVGSGVIMAMNIGARNLDEAGRVLGQSFVLATIAAGVFTLLSLVFRTQLLTLSGAGGDIFEPALIYFTITAAGSILMFWLMTIMFAFNAQGDTFTLTKLFALSTFLNLILDPLLIFGYGPVPALGIAGAAYATLISQVVFIVFAMYLLSSEKRFIRFQMKNLSFKWESVKKVLDIGVPASLTQVVGPIGLAALMYITSLGFMESGVVAFSIGFRLEFFAMLPAIGFGIAAMAMMGQNIGARNIERAQQSFRTALMYSGVGATVFGIIVIMTARLISGTFTSDETITSYVVSYVWIIALSYGFMTASMVEASAFQAVGKSWPGFWIFFTRFFVVSIPLAYVFTVILGLDIKGVWTAIAAGNIITAIGGYIWIKHTLKHIKLDEVPVHEGVG